MPVDRGSLAGRLVGGDGKKGDMFKEESVERGPKVGLVAQEETRLSQDDLEVLRRFCKIASHKELDPMPSLVDIACTVRRGRSHEAVSK